MIVKRLKNSLTGNIELGINFHLLIKKRNIFRTLKIIKLITVSKD